MALLTEIDVAEHIGVSLQTVRRWTGIPVSLGLGPTKTLAKVANRLAKRDPGLAGVGVLLEQDF